MRCKAGKVYIEHLCHLNNRGAKKCHGEILTDIYTLLSELSADVMVFVREKGFSRFPHETQALFKVMGVADLTAWQAHGCKYHELAPAAVKKLLTGNGKATKQEVANALARYVGEQIFATDDESDAVAVGIAWLKQEKRYEKFQRFLCTKPPEKECIMWPFLEDWSHNTILTLL